jgi:O-antigen ligase
MVSIAKAPWFGYGFSAFWQSDLADIPRIHSAVRFEPHYAHNGLLEMLLDGGVILAVLFTAQMVSSIAKATKFFSRGNFYTSLPLVFLLIFTLSNFAEASVLAKNSLFWVAFVALAAFTARSVRFAAGCNSAPLSHRQATYSA